MVTMMTMVTMICCVGVVYSGEYDVCDVTLSVYPHRASLKNMPGHGGNQTRNLWNTSPMLCQLSYAARMVTMLVMMMLVRVVIMVVVIVVVMMVTIKVMVILCNTDANAVNNLIRFT